MGYQAVHQQIQLCQEPEPLEPEDSLDQITAINETATTEQNTDNTQNTTHTTSVTNRARCENIPNNDNSALAQTLQGYDRLEADLGPIRLSYDLHNTTQSNNNRQLAQITSGLSWRPSIDLISLIAIAAIRYNQGDHPWQLQGTTTANIKTGDYQPNPPRLDGHPIGPGHTQHRTPKLATQHHRNPLSLERRRSIPGHPSRSKHSVLHPHRTQPSP